MEPVPTSAASAHSTPSRFSLAGRIAVVTGGAGLYGRPICTALAESGAHVVVASRDGATREALVDELAGGGWLATGWPLDLADESSIERLCAEVVSELGAIDVLVNNAVHRAGRTIDATTADDWRATSEVNSLGLFLICRAVGEQMVARRRGVIINVASIYGVVGADFGIYDGTDLTSPANYAFDKGGMISFTRHLASWLGPTGVRVNCISPGGLRTPDQPQPFVDAYTRRVPLRRLAGPDDIKGPIVFLASDASSYITGINLAVDGGWTAI